MQIIISSTWADQLAKPGSTLITASGNGSRCQRGLQSNMASPPKTPPNPQKETKFYNNTLRTNFKKQKQKKQKELATDIHYFRNLPQTITQISSLPPSPSTPITFTVPVFPVCFPASTFHLILRSSNCHHLPLEKWYFDRS